MRHRRERHVGRNSNHAIRHCIICFSVVSMVPLLLVVWVVNRQIYGGIGGFENELMRPPPPDIVATAPFVQPLADGSLPVNLTVVAARMQQRRQYLHSRCRLLGLQRPSNNSLHRPNPWEYLINHRHQLIWCNVFKAASSSWMYNFNILAGFSPSFLRKSKKIPLMTLARQRYPRPTLKTLQLAFRNSTSFLIVRHPFERLVSAYRDKLQHSLPHTYHSKLGQKIVTRYRTTGDLSTMKGGGSGSKSWPTFYEFVQYFLDCVKAIAAGGHQQTICSSLDMHWTPITQFCTPCMFDFKIVAHTETLWEDQVYLIHAAHLEPYIRPQWRNANVQRLNATDAQRNYFSQLYKSQILQLYHVFRYDFELFNYTIGGYLEVGRNDPDPDVLLAAITLKDYFSRDEAESSKLPRVY